MSKKEKIVKTSCNVEGLEPYGLFVGFHLNLRSKKSENLLKVKRSRLFYNEVVCDLEKFLEVHDFTYENVESWFQRFVFEFKLNQRYPITNVDPSE